MIPKGAWSKGASGGEFKERESTLHKGYIRPIRASKEVVDQVYTASVRLPLVTPLLQWPCIWMAVGHARLRLERESEGRRR